MPDDQSKQLHQAFRWGPWHIGDPAVLLEAILDQVEEQQQKQVLGLYLDSLSATLEANLKLVQGIRSVVAGGAQR